MKEKISKIINCTIEITIALILILVPLYFAWFYRDYSVFTLDKTVVFFVLTELLLVLTLIKILIKKDSFQLVLPRRLLIIAPFALALAIATLISIDPQASWQGSYWRQQGLFTYLHYFVFLILILLNIKSEKQIKRVLDAMIAASSLVVIYALGQWFNLEFLPFSDQVSSLRHGLPVGGRVSSTMGQPVFLASYLLFIIPITIYRLLACRRRMIKIFLACLLLAQLFALVASYSRGVWFGLVVGFIFFSYLLISYQSRTAKRYLISALVVLLLLVVGIVGFFSLSNTFRHGLFIARVKSLTNFEAGSLAIRFRYWQASLSSIVKKPLLGYGLDTQKAVLVREYEPSWAIYEKLNTSPDRAHSEPLELLLNGGIFLLSSYLLLLGAVFYWAFMALAKAKGKDWLRLALVLTGLFAYLTSLLFSFSVIETSVYFWFFISLLFLLSKGNNISISLTSFFSSRPRLLASTFAFLVISIFILCLIVTQVNKIRADIHFFEARQAFTKKDYLLMHQHYSKALELNFHEYRYQWFYVFDTSNSLAAIDSSDYRDSALKQIAQVMELNQNRPPSYSWLLLNAQYQTALGKYQNEEHFSQADDFYQRLIGISPYMPESYRALAEMHFVAGNYKQAVFNNKRALAVLPSLDTPYVNAKHKQNILEFVFQVYSGLAKSYEKLEDYEKARDYYERMITMNPHHYEAYKNIADVYFLEKNWPKAIEYLERGAMLSPHDYTWPYSLALLYQAWAEELGESDDKIKVVMEYQELVQQYAQKALELNPKNQAIKNLLLDSKN